jgi:hypothetical protein
MGAVPELGQCQGRRYLWLSRTDLTDFIDAWPVQDRTTERLAVLFRVNDGRMFVIDLPDDMTGVYRDVLVKLMSAYADWTPDAFDKPTSTAQELISAPEQSPTGIRPGRYGIRPGRYGEPKCRLI